jgi:hypothetical protein
MFVFNRSLIAVLAPLALLAAAVFFSNRDTAASRPGAAIASEGAAPAAQSNRQTVAANLPSR